MKELKGHETVVFVGDSRYSAIGRSLARDTGAEPLSIIPNHPGNEEIGRYLIVNNYLGSIGAERAAYPIPCAEANPMACRDPGVKRLLLGLRNSGSGVTVVPYSADGMTKQVPGVTYVMSDPGVASLANDKIYQREFAKRNGIPVARGTMVDSIEAVEKEFDKYGRIFVSKTHSTTGSGCEKIVSREQIRGSGKFYGDNPYIVAELIEAESSPSCVGIAVSGDRVVICGTTDQILDGTEYRGNVAPSLSMTGEERMQAENIARRTGIALSRELGYRGPFGIDLVKGYDHRGEKVMVVADINPRFTGWTSQLVRHWDASRGEYPGLVQMVKQAVETGDVDYPLDRLELEPIHWAIYQPVYPKGTEVMRPVENEMTEDDIFERGSGTVVEGVYRPNTVLFNKGKVGRVVSVGQSKGEVLAGLHRGQKKLERALMDPELKLKMIDYDIVNANRAIGMAMSL